MTRSHVASGEPKVREIYIKENFISSKQKESSKEKIKQKAHLQLLSGRHCSSEFSFCHHELETERWEHDVKCPFLCSLYSDLSHSVDKPEDDCVTVGLFSFAALIVFLKKTITSSVVFMFTTLCVHTSPFLLSQPQNVFFPPLEIA